MRIPVTASTNYALSIDASIETTVYRILAVSSSDIPVIGTPITGTLLAYSSIDNAVTFTTPADTVYIVLQFSGTVFDDCINTLMLCLGSTPKPYEPYGVKVPIVFNSVTYNTYISDYLRKSSGESPVYDVMSSDGSLIRAVNADGTAKEEPTTEAYTAPDLTSLWGWNTFDVDTAVDPSNVIIQYKDT